MGRVIKNIILDIGDVLVRFMPEEAVNQVGVPKHKRQAVLDATVGSVFWPELDRGVMEESEVIDKMIMAAPDCSDEINRFFQYGKEWIVEEFEYTRPWIQTMKEAGLRVYLLSNYPKSYFEIHKQNQLSFVEMVDGMMISACEGIVKPEEEIYKKLLNKYNLIPEECLFFDDRAVNVEGAKACGICASVFTGIDDAIHTLHEYGICSI